MMRVPLKEIVDFKKESVTPDKIVDSTSYVGLEHVFSDGRISFIQVNNGDLASNKFKFTENHILYGKLRPYLRKIALPSFAGICSTDIVPLLPLKDKVVTEYLYHFLRSPDMVKLATERCSGANLPRISPKEIAEFKIPLPPLDQQRKIASILDTADAYRQKTKALILKYDELTQSLFLDMFGDLFISIFDELNRKFAAELEAVQSQFPFEPLQYSRPALRLHYYEGMKLLQDAGYDGEYIWSPLSLCNQPS